jgi:hypothetical protein
MDQEEIGKDEGSGGELKDPPPMADAASRSSCLSFLKRRKALVALALMVCLICAGLVLFFARSGGEPKLSVTYKGRVAVNGGWRLRFGITNAGSVAVVSSSFGIIEVANLSKPFSVGSSGSMQKLTPGEGLMVDVSPPKADMKLLDGKWRYICLFGKNSLRSSIYRWQWGPHGPGRRVNWLIPQRLKGIPLTVKGRSDWIQGPGSEMQIISAVSE